PCEVAAELDAEGLNVRVHTVGLFLTDPAAEQQLQCIADATGGEFRRVDSLIDLVRDLTGIATQSFAEGPGRILPVVIGSLERMTAPVLSLEPPQDPGWQALSAGAVSTIATGETRWFAVDVEESGSWQLQFSAELPWQLEPEDGEYFEVEIYDATGTPIGSPHEVLGVIVDAPQRTYLSDAAEYRLFGESVAAIAVTDAASAPPGWPGDEADDPYMARIRDRFLAAGVNGGLYELWKWQSLGEPLAAGRYYAGVTWSADRQAATEMEVGAHVFPAGAGAPPRDRPTDFALMTGASPGEDRVEPAFGDWTGGRVGGDTPRRAAEVWTRVAVGDPVTYTVRLEEGEVLEVGIQGGSPYSNQGLSFEVSLATEEGTPVGDLRDDADHGIRPTGYPQGGLWEASSSGTYGLTIEANATDPGDENLAAIIAMFVFPPDPEPIVATTTTRPDQSAQEPEGHEEPGDTPLGLLIVATGVVLIGGAAGVWWFRRRRR
ncbi:MAG: hypothetical protein MUP76_02020, partial [Acidimicrobiia bacterium]|nr:hypothetical protein [Acidimicrobiia bacterium]